MNLNFKVYRFLLALLSNIFTVALPGLCCVFLINLVWSSLLNTTLFSHDNNLLVFFFSL